MPVTIKYTILQTKASKIPDFWWPAILRCRVWLTVLFFHIAKGKNQPTQQEWKNDHANNMPINKVHKASTQLSSVNTCTHRWNIGVRPECMYSTEKGAFVTKQHGTCCFRVRTVIFNFPCAQDMNAVEKQHAKKNSHRYRACKGSWCRFCFDFHTLKIK